MLGEEDETIGAYCPDWYGIIQAANYLHVAPWELLEQSVWWRDVAFKAMAAESQAQEIQRQHEK